MDAHPTLMVIPLLLTIGDCLGSDQSVGKRYILPSILLLIGIRYGNEVEILMVITMEIHSGHNTDTLQDMKILVGVFLIMAILTPRPVS